MLLSGPNDAVSGSVTGEALDGEADGVESKGVFI